jgi:gliding motility-associated-like protein
VGILKKITQAIQLLTLTVVMLLVVNKMWANHLVGGELTWACLGTGEYIFQVKVYQDCNQFQPPPTSMQIKVWNNPNLSIIPLTNVGSNDFSLVCTEVPGGDPQYDCATPGSGSISEYVLQSAPLTLTGVPPVDGWHFTWDAFFRTGVAQNLTNAQNAGLTLHASMYSYNGQSAAPCFDNSPQFIKPPLNVVCASEDIAYNIGGFDSDLDSISYQFADALNNDFGTNFTPPTSPSIVAWEAGYSTNNQLPNSNQNAANTGATLNPSSGALTFNAVTLGNFSTVVKVESWRCGQLIAVVYREMLINIVNCAGSNIPPTMTLSGITGNAVTVNAGDIVTFDILAQDNGLLSNGADQSVTLNIYGGEVGDGLTNPNSGCPFTPCATASGGMPLTNPQIVNSTFNWETSCNLFTEDCYRPQKTFYFTIVAQDDYCSLPGQNETTVAITVNNQPPIESPPIHCADVAANGAVTLNWDAPVNSNNSFQEYRIYASNNTSYNLVGTIPNINTTTFNHPNADAHIAPVKYLVKSVYGCNSSESLVLDTVSTIFLTVNNPSDGTAVLQWNPMSVPPISSAYNWYYIYQEYPAGTWTLIDSTEYGDEYYRDTIAVCDAFLNYKIELKDQSGCSSFSNIDGDQFQDMLPPNLPLLNWVTVDTATGNAALNWNPSSSEDASAYIVFQFFGGGWIAIDTVHGYNSTNYTYLNSNADDYSETYALAVYDSCFSPTPNTSPLGIQQETMFITTTLDVCQKTVALKWNAYKNWIDHVKEYQIEASVNGGPYNIVGVTTDTSFVFEGGLANTNYCFLVKAVANDAVKTSLSNISCLFLHQPPTPAFNYLQTATVVDDHEIEVRVHQDLAAQISNFRLERSSDNSPGSYEEIAITAGTNTPIVFNDLDVSAKEQAYFYRVMVEDSCGRPTTYSNIGKTIVLNVTENTTQLSNLVQWSAYQQWNGNIIAYEVYRSINGVFETTPVVTLPPNKFFYNDDVSDVIGTTVEGEFCYYVKAVESTNTFGINETSESNVNCAYQNPIVYVPNALLINGHNNTWKPVVSLIEYDSYEVRVFNRFSEIIFETNDVHQAWDGTHRKNGKMVQHGLYIYQITFRRADGEYQELRGHITLIR